MNRSLRIYIVKSKALGVFVHYPGRDLLIYNFREHCEVPYYFIKHSK